MLESSCKWYVLLNGTGYTYGVGMVDVVACKQVIYCTMADGGVRVIYNMLGWQMLFVVRRLGRLGYSCCCVGVVCGCWKIVIRVITAVVN